MTHVFTHCCCRPASIDAIAVSRTARGGSCPRTLCKPLRLTMHSCCFTFKHNLAWLEAARVSLNAECSEAKISCAGAPSTKFFASQSRTACNNNFFNDGIVKADFTKPAVHWICKTLMANLLQNNVQQEEPGGRDASMSFWLQAERSTIKLIRQYTDALAALAAALKA